MTAVVPKARAHLVERAVEALGGTAALDRLAPQPPAGGPEAAAPTSAAPESSGPTIGRDALLRAGLAPAPARHRRSRMLEELTLIQQQIQRAMHATQPEQGRCSRAVLVTSARPGEGKTFSALNIAASIAADGARPVVLVDADPKAGSVSHLLGCGDVPGLRSLAADPSRRTAQLLVPTEVPGLSFLPHGTPPTEGGGSRSGAMVASAILRLAATAPQHVLVIDAPPCLSTSDASALAPVVGQVVVVVEAERTQRSEVEAALDMVEACPTLQLLLNRVRLSSNDTFGAYDGYYGAQKER